MIDPGMLQLMIYPLVGLMLVGMVMGMFKNSFKKKKKEVEVPRDTVERLTKAYKVMAKGGLNRRRVRHTLWISGDRHYQGYKLGDVVALQPMNEEVLVYVKWKWWYFWKRALPIHLDIELITDWNCRDIVAEAKGIEAVTEGLYYLIPCGGILAGTLEVCYIQRFKNRSTRVLKQSIIDADIDSDVIPKIALRGNIETALIEIGKHDDMPIMSEDEIRRQQKRRLKESNQGGMS